MTSPSCTSVTLIQEVLTYTASHCTKLPSLLVNFLQGSDLEMIACSSSYPEGETAAPDEEVEPMDISSLEDGYQMTLPSGKTVGHR